MNMLEINNISEKIRRRGANKVFIQIPEGLKTQALSISKKLEMVGIQTFICIETCYGACDLRDYEAEKLGCDLILHIGHSDLGIKTRIPVLYEEFKINFNPIPLLKKNISKLKPYKKISLVTTLQFVSCLEKSKKFLEGEGKRIFIGSPIKAKYGGQILGCDFSAAEPLEKLVDCFLFMGSGLFHPLGLAATIKKPVLFLNFETGELLNMDHEKTRLEKIRYAHIEKAKSCKNFGILISLKPGQTHLKMAENIKKRLEKARKNAFILVFDEITPEKIMGMQLDGLINCACPRLSEDFESFKKIILNPEDVEKLLK